MSAIERVDQLVARGGEFMPYWGWHDDHRHLDGTPEYRPALQQVRGEFAEFLSVLVSLPPGGACLQLGMGECDASHEALRLYFDRVVTLDWRCVAVDDRRREPGVDIASIEGVRRALQAMKPSWDEAMGVPCPFDLLFIDADHSELGTARDHANYGPLVRPGGIVAFHDALRRPGFEEAVQVWRYLETLSVPVHVIGSEVGIAWLRK